MSATTPTTAPSAPPDTRARVRRVAEGQALAAWLDPLVQRVWRDRSATKGPADPCWTDDPLDAGRLVLHARGIGPRGAGLIVPGTSTVRALALDFDSHKGETSWSDMLGVVGRVVCALQARGVAPMVFRSGGGRGAHAWALWDEPQDAYSVRALAFEALAACGLRDGTGGVKAGEVEVFPKQDMVPPGGSGNFIFLPFTGQSELLEPALNYAAPVPLRDLLSEQWPMSEPVPKRERPPRSERQPVAPGSADRVRLRRALAAIPNGGEAALPYDTWRNVVFGIMHGCDGDDEGKALAHEFSARAAKYDPEFLDNRVLPYVKANGGRTVGTVFKLAREHGWNEAGPEDFDDLGDAAAEGDGKADGARAHGRFRVQALAEFLATPEVEFIVEALLPTPEHYGGISMVSGRPGEGKSWFVMNLVLHIAAGLPWRGHAVRGGRVVYIAAEGARGLAARMREAIAQRPEFSGADIGVIAERPNLFVDNGKAADELAAAIGQAAVIVIDTMFATSAGADLNGADAARLLSHALRLSKKTGAMVLFVHHTGKEGGRGPMGSTVLLANPDTSVEVSKKKTAAGDIFEVCFHKVRDGKDGARFFFKLEGHGASAVVVPTEAPTGVAGRDGKPLGKWKGHVLAAMGTLAGLGGDPVAVGKLIAAAAAREVRDPAPGADGKPKPDRRRELAREAINGLVADGAFVKVGEGAVRFGGGEGDAP
jgi:hypothetical protein